MAYKRWGASAVVTVRNICLKVICLLYSFQDGKLVVVGGRNENQELLGTTEELDVSSWFWKSLSNITDGKSHHCQVGEPFFDFRYCSFDLFSKQYKMKVFGGKTLPVTDKSVYYLKPDGTWKSWPKPKLQYNRIRAGCIYFKRK